MIYGLASRDWSEVIQSCHFLFLFKGMPQLMFTRCETCSKSGICQVGKSPFSFDRDAFIINASPSRAGKPPSTGEDQVREPLAAMQAGTGSSGSGSHRPPQWGSDIFRAFLPNFFLCRAPAAEQQHRSAGVGWATSGLLPPSCWCLQIKLATGIIPEGLGSLHPPPPTMVL